MPEGTDFDFMEINIVDQEGIQKKIKATGVVSTVIDNVVNGASSTATDVYVDSSGYIYVLTWSGTVKKYDSQGNSRFCKV